MIEKYTRIENTEIVSVGEFRSRVRHLERVFHNDRHACVGDAEKAGNLRIMFNVMQELICTESKRAKFEDWEERERIIDKCSSYIRNCIFKRC